MRRPRVTVFTELFMSAPQKSLPFVVGIENSFSGLYRGEKEGVNPEGERSSGRAGVPGDRDGWVSWIRSLDEIAAVLTNVKRDECGVPYDIQGYPSGNYAIYR